jgi:drug/metabolite transporter (DMT)-like permease
VNPAVPLVVLLVSSTLWGLTWMPLKHFGSFGIEGTWVTLVGYGSVGVVALPWLLVRRASWWEARGTMALLVLFGGLANVCFASAIVSGDVTRVMVLFYLLPAWGVLGGRLLLGERIDGRRRASLAVAVLGAFLILGGPAVFRSPPGWVDVVATISGLALAMNNVLFRKLQNTPVAPKIAATFVGCLLWAMVLTSLDLGGAPNDVPIFVWGEVVAFGSVWVLLATVGTLFGVHHMEAGRSSVLIIMELVTAVVSASLLSGKTPTPLEWVGAFFILVAALLEGYRPAARASA